MKPIIYVNSNLEKSYKNEGVFSEIRDSFKISLLEEIYEKELNLNIKKVYLPPNLNKSAYFKNYKKMKRYSRREEFGLAPKVFRPLDFNIFNDFFKKMFSYSVVNSTRIVLRNKNKSIRSNCIVVFDAADSITKPIIEKLSEEGKYIVLLSSSIDKLKKLQEYIVANYGVSPIVTMDYKYSFKAADFIISSRELPEDINKPIWFLNNTIKAQNNNAIFINDIGYKTPWNMFCDNASFELVSAILFQMEEGNIEKALKYNGIYLEQIKFNNEVLTIY